MRERAHLETLFGCDVQHVSGDMKAQLVQSVPQRPPHAGEVRQRQLRDGCLRLRCQDTAYAIGLGALRCQPRNQHIWPNAGARCAPGRVKHLHYEQVAYRVGRVFNRYCYVKKRKAIGE